MSDRSAPSVLLGGVGADGHSVGLHLIRRTLSACGYDVYFRGVRNDIRDLIALAESFNVVMVSIMDGHARHYLQGLRDHPLVKEEGGPLWYLGGNLTTGDAGDCERELRTLGFDRVFAKFVDIESVLRLLEEDLRDRAYRAPQGDVARELGVPPSRGRRAGAIGRLVDERFLRERIRVLQEWPTGARAASLEENARYLAKRRSFPALLAQTERTPGAIVIQPRSGVSDDRLQEELFLRFREAGAGAVSYQVDSLTRNNDYRGAAELIEEDRASGGNALNGFPVVSHGVPTLRRIAESVDLPIQTRHSTRDPRLLAEVSYAGGVSAFEGGAICYNLPYFKDYSLEDSIETWKYVDRLTGLYYERYGVVLDREFFGTLTATLIPPCLPIVTNVLEALLAARQGVRCVSLAYAEQGNRVQDVAAVRTMAALGRELLDRHGHEDVRVHTVFHQYMAAFPEDPAKARQLILSSAVTAALAGATRLITKTPLEARRIPTGEENARSLALSQRGVRLAARCSVSEDAVAREVAAIRGEALTLFDTVLDLGRGRLEDGIVRAFSEGVLDVPFSPSLYNRGRVLTARDDEGAIRFVDFGGMPFGPEIRARHEERMAGRLRAHRSSRADLYRMIEVDTLRVAREDYDLWPLDGPCPAELEGLDEAVTEVRETGAMAG